MAINIYVGPLVRFYSGNWKPVFIEGGSQKNDDKERGHAAPFADEKVSPVELRNYIIEWRKQISHALKKHLNGPLVWSETPDTAYYTDRPDRYGYDALRLWAAYAENPDIPKPTELSANVEDDPALLASKETEETEFAQILSNVVIWLPFNLDIVFDAEFLNYDEPISVGSSGALFEQLKRLNAKTWNASMGEITSWRELKRDDSAPLESSAKYGFSLFFYLAQLSVMNKLPMALYY